MTSINDRLDVFAEWWDHEEGDRLVGVVVDRDRRDGEFGAYHVLTVRVREEGSTEKGGQPIPVGEERAFHANSTVAASETQKQDPQPGDTFGVKYHGVRAGGREGRGYRLYKMAVEKPGGEPQPEQPQPELRGMLADSDELPF